MNKTSLTLLLDPDSGEPVALRRSDDPEGAFVIYEEVSGTTGRVWSVEAGSTHLRIVRGAPIARGGPEGKAKLCP